MFVYKEFPTLAYFLLQTLESVLEISNSTKNFLFNYTIATKIAIIIWTLSVFELAKNKLSCIEITLGIRVLSIDGAEEGVVES